MGGAAGLPAQFGCQFPGECMQLLRNLLTTDDGQLSNLAISVAVIAIIFIVGFLFLDGEVSTVSRGVGSSV
jgi:hypothetical protein